VWTVLGKYMPVIYKIGDAQPHPANEVIFACVVRSALNLHTSHSLTMSGLFGPARPLLRLVFEALMIAKYCATDPTSDVYDRWIDGIDIYFTHAVLKKLAQRRTDEFERLWKVLNLWSHATIQEGQGTMRIENTRPEALLNLGLSNVFLHWMYHLIFSHIVTPTVRYYGEAYGTYTQGTQARARLKVTLKGQRGTLSKESIALVRDFQTTWKIK
jgi:hypothetical protein